MYSRDIITATYTFRNDIQPFSSLLTTFFSVKATRYCLTKFYCFISFTSAVISYIADTAKLDVAAADHSGHLSITFFLFQAKLETKALKAKRPGFTDERYNETSYYVEHGQYSSARHFVFNPVTTQGRRSRLILWINWINASLFLNFDLKNRENRSRVSDLISPPHLNVELNDAHPEIRQFR